MMLSLPFFLMLMTGIAAILTMGTLKKSDNLKFIVLGLIIIVLVFYFKDLSIALGQTNRISLILSVWAPVIALSLFTFIGVLQINENKLTIFFIFYFILMPLSAENLTIEAKNISLDKNREISIFRENVKIVTDEGNILKSEYVEYDKKKVY